MSSSITNGAVADVTMPQMGVSVVEGTVVEWKVRVGEPVTAGETVCEISTDKIDSEVPAPADGVVSEVLVAVGDTVAVGSVLARLALGSAEPTLAPGPAEPTLVAQPRKANGYSPLVQRIAAEHGIDLSTVAGTGRGGRVRKQDVLALVHGDPPLHTESPYRPGPEPEASPRPDPEPEASPPPAPASSGGLSRMRRTIGEHMKRSLQEAATCTTWIEADMSAVERERSELGLTALAYVARASVLALRAFPALNAWLEGERYTRFAHAVHLGIAVSLGEAGLIVPVVRDAQLLSVEGLGARIRELAARARAGELTPEEVRGATFTITNPGQYGTIMATPIINQPQVGILDLEAIVKRPVVVTDPGDGGDTIAIRPMTILGLSWDHRALDGAVAAQFLAAMRRELESGVR
ncbi:MAG TPA: dihydrolipoamide acetyltransferase family protein [Solirubrobacteraceae bacterium]|nr:dihydrolipoamide acetyltransferase family protein [Solirubrobacteraceae bacterium]